MLGLEITSTRAKNLPGGGERWAEFRGGVRAAGALHGTDEATDGPSGTVVFRVDDLEPRGGPWSNGGSSSIRFEAEVPGFARFATFHDPDGNPFQLIEYRLT